MSDPLTQDELEALKQFVAAVIAYQPTDKVVPIWMAHYLRPVPPHIEFWLRANFVGAVGAADE
jgi:hypothetical protein